MILNGKGSSTTTLVQLFFFFFFPSFPDKSTNVLIFCSFVFANNHFYRHKTCPLLPYLFPQQEWCRAKTKVGSVRVRQWEKAWSKRHNLNAAILNEVSDLVRELKKRLAMFNIEPTYNPQHRYEGWVWLSCCLTFCFSRVTGTFRILRIFSY